MNHIVDIHLLNQCFLSCSYVLGPGRWARWWEMGSTRRKDIQDGAHILGTSGGGRVTFIGEENSYNSSRGSSFDERT